jgi:hypothetical protein
MKRISLRAVFFIFTLMPAYCLAFDSQHSSNTSDTSVRSPLSDLISLYYELKDALVADDASLASVRASALLQALNNIDAQKLSERERKIFGSLQPKLSYDARHISEVKAIEHQREHFAALSLNMSKLAKEARVSDHPVYKMYCPMKKSYWLSKESVIANPYYGKEMVTCGEISEVIK